MMKSVAIVVFGGVCLSMIASCTVGNATQNTKAVTMKPFNQICNPARFNGEVQAIYANLPLSQEESTCLPAIYDAENPSAPVSTEEENLLARYYYNQDFAGTCPAIESMSELPFPESSPYVQDQKEVVGQILNCLGKVDLTKINKPVFVFDVDDTLVADAYIGQCSVGFTFEPKVWDQALADNAMQPVPEMGRVLQYAFDNNIAVAIVTARSQSQENITLNNLIAAYPQFESNLRSVFTHQNLIYLKPESQETWTASSFKNQARQEIINQGYTIVLNVGDQYSDLNYNAIYNNTAICSYKLANMIYYLP